MVNNMKSPQEGFPCFLTISYKRFSGISCNNHYSKGNPTLFATIGAATVF